MGGRQTLIHVYLMVFNVANCDILLNVTTTLPENNTSTVNATATPIVLNFETPQMYEYYYVIPNMERGIYTRLRLEDLDDYLNQTETQTFLSSIPSGYKRDAVVTQLRFCPYTELCGFSFGVFPPLGASSCCAECNCDFPACLVSETCCIDIILDHLDVINNTVNTDKLQKSLRGKDNKVQKQCFTLYLSKYANPSARSVYLYSTCPADSEIEIAKNCTRAYYEYEHLSLSDITPVWSDYNQELYRNTYCAFCHGESAEHLSTVDVNLKCTEFLVFNTDSDILSAIYEDGKCDIEFQFQEDIHANYCITVISECSSTGTFEEEMCSMYKSTIYIKGLSYKNIFCAICNGVYPEDLACVMEARTESTGIFSFSGLLVIDRSKGVGSNRDDRDKCSQNQLYDYIKGSCKDLTCSTLAVLKKGECVQLIDKLEKTIYTTFLRLKPKSRLPIRKAFEVADQIIAFMGGFLNESELCGAQMIYKTDRILNNSDLISVQNSNLLYFDARFQYYVHNYHDPNIIVESIRNIHNAVFSFKINKNETIEFDVQQRDGQSRRFDIVSLLARSREISDGLYYSNGHAERLSLTYLVKNYIESDNGFAIFPHLRRNDALGTCIASNTEFHIFMLTTCPKVNISKSDVHWKVIDEGISIDNGYFIIDSSEYKYIDEDHILVCSDMYKQYMAHVSQSNNVRYLSAESIVSIICSAMSILALCCTFFVFCFFPKLRETIPGKNNMSLTFTLMLAQTLYLFGSFSNLRQKSTECFILGVLIHYSWLVALFWMNICTFHMFRVLAKTKVISHTSDTKKLMMYNTYAQLMAVMFVSINIGISYTKTGELGYGQVTCYISSQEMIMYTFAIPAALIVLSNICMFTYVVIIIKRSPSVQKSVQNERNDIIVFAKLSTITGTTWVFGLLYIWTKVSVLSYIFILLNASQGVFIMLAFVINKRVFDLFRSKVLGMTLASSESGYPTTKSVDYTTKH